MVGRRLARSEGAKEESDGLTTLFCRWVVRDGIAPPLARPFTALLALVIWELGLLWEGVGMMVGSRRLSS